MEKIFFVYFLISCGSAETMNLNISSENSTQLAESISIVIDFFVAQGISTVNVFSVDNKNDFTVADLKEKLLTDRLKSFNVLFRQETVEKIRAIENRRKACNIFLIKNVNEFHEIDEQINSKRFKISGLYLVAVTSRSFLRADEIFLLVWKKQIYNVIVMSEEDSGEISVQTFFPFTENSCHDTQPRLINQFRNGSFLRKDQKLFPEKIKNLFKCPINVSTSNESASYIIVKQLANGSYELSGRDINLIKSLAQSLNFRINYSFVGNIGYFLSNGTSVGPLKALLDKKSDFSINSWFLKEHRLNYFDSTSSYVSEPLVFIIPPGRELTPFEKLIFPFKFEIWMLILTCFVVGILVIFITTFGYKSNRSFVFGAGVRHPCFNMFNAFIGGAQNVLPKRNFARVLLMIFVFYSLIIRTLYQASFYQILQSNKLLKEVNSIDEMMKRDFRFYVPLGYADVFQGTNAMQTKLL